MNSAPELLTLQHYTREKAAGMWIYMQDGTRVVADAEGRVTLRDAVCGPLLGAGAWNVIDRRVA